MFADAALHLARWISPPERAPWVDAMRAECVALDSHRLRWAFGSLAVAIGWRLNVEKLYLLLVAVTAWLVWNANGDRLLTTLAPASVWREFLRAGWSPGAIFLFLASLGIGLYRPKFVVATTFIIILYSAIYRGYLTIVIGNARQDWHTMFNYILVLGPCLSGGLLGRALSPRRARTVR